MFSTLGIKDAFVLSNKEKQQKKHLDCPFQRQDLWNGQVRNFKNLLFHKSHEDTGKNININFFRTLENRKTFMVCELYFNKCIKSAYNLAISLSVDGHLDLSHLRMTLCDIYFGEKCKNRSSLKSRQPDSEESCFHAWCMSCQCLEKSHI